MSTMILKVHDGKYQCTARGSEMTLVREGNQWAMYTVNASVRAYNNGHAMPKYFRSLEDVEKKYKSWQGIAGLVESRESIEN